MAEVYFTFHSLLKLAILSAHGFDIDRATVEDTVRAPDKIDSGYKGREVRQKGLSPTHVLRVICEVRGDHVTVVTVYPGRRERYEKD